jgi:hypothetical protein
MKGALNPLTRGEYADAIEAIGKLMFVYSKDYSAQVSEKEQADLQRGAQKRAMVYLEQVRDQPAWAIKLAVDRWLRAEAGDYDYHWLPMPPEFRLVVLAQTGEHRAVLAKVERLLNAVAMPTGEASEGQHQRIKSGFDKLLHDLARAADPVPPRHKREAAE